LSRGVDRPEEDRERTSEQGDAVHERQERVLFVDDEPDVIAGLRRVLHRHRDDWAMVFTESPEAALDVLAAEPVDVIVTDLLMPGVDGAELLRRARDLQPGAARLILTGHTHRDASMRALPVAHQMLSKPCDPADLSRAIDRACAVRGLLNDPKIQGAVGSLDALPSVPAVLTQVNACLERGAPPREIAAVLEHDGVVVSKVLQLVNSSFFGLGRRITDVVQAIAYLGIDVLRSIVASASCFQAFDSTRDIRGFSLPRLHAHAFDTGRMCRPVAQRSRNVPDTVAAALLQDLGQVLLASALPEDFGEVVAEVGSARALHEAELEHFGFTHAEVGAYLLALWGLPNDVVEAVATHHSDGPLEPLTSPSPSTRGLPMLSVADAVRVGRALVGSSERYARDPMDTNRRRFPPEWLEALGGEACEPVLRAIVYDPEGARP
jgi:HD-like signal output (HDOD) protein